MNPPASHGRRPVGASRRAVLSLAALSFAAGALATGILGHERWCKSCSPDAGWSRPGRSWSEDQAERWARALELAPAQRTSLAATLGELQPRYAEVYALSRTRRAAIDRDLEARVRAIATPEQRVRLDAAIARDERRRAEYYGRPVEALPAKHEPLGQDEVDGESPVQ